MKKFLALFLTFSMLLSLLTMPTVASGEDVASEPAMTRVVPLEELKGKSTYSYNNKTYYVVSSLAQFESMEDGKNYILASNIDFGSGVVYKNRVGASTNFKNFHLEGNGCTVTISNFQNSDTGGYGLFKRPYGAAGNEIKISNITFRVTGKLAQNSAGVIFGTNDGDTNGLVSFENVVIDANVTYTHTDGDCALFYAKARMPVSFTNCMVKGYFGVEGGVTARGAAAFVGYSDKAVAISFINCQATGTYNLSVDLPNNLGNAVFLGYCSNAGVSVSFQNCAIVNATVNMGSRQSGLFYARATGAMTFQNCSITNTTMETAAGQIGGFVGLMSGTVDAELTGCTSDMTLFAQSDRVSPFIGQAYCNGSIDVTSCKVSGIVMSTGIRNGAFMGVAGGESKAPAVTFYQCETDVFMAANGQACAYVASDYNGTPTLKFNSCTNQSHVYTNGPAGSWIAETTNANTKVYFDQAPENDPNDAKYDPNYKTCVTQATIYSKSLYSGDGASWTSVSTNEVQNGAFAYEIAQAQKAIGITDPDYLYGQKIGTDATPVRGGETVYKLPLPQTDPVYSNVPVFGNYYLVETEDVYYHQREDLGDKSNHRIVIPIQEDKMISLASLEVEVVYTLKSGKTKTLRVNQGQLSCFCAVYAGDRIAMAPEGYLLLALTVNNIPKSEWDGGAFTVEVTETPLDSALTLKFGSYNIFQSRFDKTPGKEMENIANVILENQLDVIGLVEVDNGTQREAGDTPFNTLEKLMEQTGYYGAYFPAMNHYTGGEYGDAILSKYPIKFSEKIMLPTWEGKDCYGKDFEPRVLGHAIIDVNGEEIHFFVTHLDHTDLDLVQEQMDYIAEVLSEYDNFVLTGDFNTSDFSQYESIQNAGMVNNHNFSIVTFPKNYVSIDNIVYSSKNWRFGLPHTIKESYSDHYALYATGVFMK